MDYPGNSQRARADDEPKEKTKEKKIEQVAQGNVVRRKKPLGTKFKETFVGGDARSVWGYVFLDVLIPALKDMVADAGSQGIERMIFGDTRSRHRRSGIGGPGGHVNYNRYSSRSPYGSDRDREPRREPSRRARAVHDFDEVILESRGEAEQVIDGLFELMSKYDQATVADLYGLVGITPNFTDEKWGWTDMRGAGPTRVKGGGYLLDLPRPEPLD